jgi:hypothetical protein
MKNLFIRYGAYGIVLSSFVLTAITALIIECYFFPVNDLKNFSLMGPKVTLLSVIIALGIVQYNYFYQECRQLEDRIEKRDFGPSWSTYVQETEKFRKTLENPDIGARMKPEDIETFKLNLKHMDEAIAKAREEFVGFLDNILADFAFRFGMVFSIALFIFSSLALDFIFQVWGLERLNPGFYSIVTFFVALVLVLIYLIFLVFLIQTHIRNFQNNARNP